MKISKVFSNFFSKKSIRQPFSNGITSMFSSIGDVFGGKRDYVAEYKNWVYSCVTARSQDVAEIGLRLFKGDQEIHEHPVLDLINKVNPYMTKHDLFNATQTYKDLDGNCYWFLAREDRADGKGEVKEIYILRPDRVQIITDKENPLLIKGYAYKQSNSAPIVFEPTEIIHHKNFNPNGNHPLPSKGMGVVEAAYSSVFTDGQMRVYNAAFFKNSARPDGMLIPSGDSAMSPEEYTRLKEEWNEEHQGSENASKIAILQGGLKWQDISRSQNDMQFIDQKRFNRDEIMAIFRVPKTLVGITEDVNRANADAAIYVFSLKTIKPLMQAIVDTLNEFLLPNFGDDRLRFEFKSPVPDDRDALRADFTAGIDKWFSRNEIRGLLGLTPTANGDQFIGTLNQIPVDNTIKPKPSKAKKEIEIPEKKSVVDNIVDRFTAKLPKTKGVKLIEGLAKSNYIEIWKNHLAISEAPFKKKLVAYFEKQEKEVMKNIKNEFKGLEAKEFKFKGVSDLLFDEDEAVSTGISLITPFIKEYIKKSGEQGTVLAGGNTFDLETPKIEKFIPARAKYFAESITKTTSDKLVASIQEGIDNGEDLDAISERVASIYDIAKGSRTDMIARTEVAASSNFGSTEAYLQAGVEKHQWIVVDPEDEDCLVNDGDIAKIGEPFNDGSTEAPIHPNCQCTTLPVFAD